MKRSILAIAALLAAVAPAAAQYYPYPPQGYYPPRPPPPYYRPDPYGGGWGGGYYQRPVAIGNVCVTSRGSCQARPRPVQSPCGCNIPGFGPKRGAIVQGGGW